MAHASLIISSCGDLKPFLNAKHCIAQFPYANIHLSYDTESLTNIMNIIFMDKKRFLLHNDGCCVYLSARKPEPVEQFQNKWHMVLAEVANPRKQG